VRSRKPRPGGFGHHVRRYYGRCAGCFRWTGTGARRVTPPRPRPRKPGLKSKSRGLETSVEAAAERREASAPEAGGPCKRMVRGARRARSANGWQQPLAWRGQFSVCAFRRSASPHFLWRRNISGFRSCCKTRARMRRENAITFRPRWRGDGRKERNPPCKNAASPIPNRKNIAIGTLPPKSWPRGPIATFSAFGALALIARAVAPAAAAATKSIASSPAAAARPADSTRQEPTCGRASRERPACRSATRG
jgi:hypothetical protein